MRRPTKNAKAAPNGFDRIRALANDCLLTQAQATQFEEMLRNSRDPHARAEVNRLIEETVAQNARPRVE